MFSHGKRKVGNRKRNKNGYFSDVDSIPSVFGVLLSFTFVFTRDLRMLLFIYSRAESKNIHKAVILLWIYFYIILVNVIRQRIYDKIHFSPGFNFLRELLNHEAFCMTSAGVHSVSVSVSVSFRKVLYGVMVAAGKRVIDTNRRTQA